MIKFKILFSFFFILAFQMAFSASYLPKEELYSTMDVETENVVHLEENNHSPFIFGEVPVGQGHLIVSFPETQRFLVNLNSKDLHMARIQSILNSTTIQGKTIYFGCSSYSILNTPIYLQIDNFRL